MHWLADCRNQCQAENVDLAYKTISAYVDSVIAGQKESDMVDTAIVGLALKDEKNLEAALRIGKNFDEIRHDVMRTFLRCVRDGLKEWVKKNDEEWEVVETWPGGNWIEQPLRNGCLFFYTRKPGLQRWAWRFRLNIPDRQRSLSEFPDQHRIHGRSRPRKIRSDMESRTNSLDKRADNESQRRSG